MKLGIALPTSHQGVYLPSPFAGGEEIADIARMAERYGFDSAWVLDFMTPSYARHEQPGAVPEWYEALTSLAYVAAVTGTIRLGTAVAQLPLRELQTESGALMLVRAAANARAALQAGVITLRDLGSRNRVALDLRDAVDAGLVPGPRILACGRPITCPGGHCHFLGGVAQGVDEVAALAHELVEEGVDVIKVMATGGNMTASSDPLHAQFTVEEIRAAVEIAHASDRRVTVHARGVEGMRRSLLAGLSRVAP